MNDKKFESEKIEAWHKKLNSKELRPDIRYRRNAGVYPLVCYVNNIVSLYLSHNEDPIPVFIGRARKHMKKYPDTENCFEYYKMVTNYLDEIENHLKNHGMSTKSIYNYKEEQI
jgi:hypothetical protein